MHLELHGSHVVALIVGAAFLCQWFAWRTRVPAILYLLVTGLAVGPLLRRPELSEGVEQFARGFVPVAAALILFEGGLNTRYRDIKEVARPLRGLVTVGLLTTWALTSVFAYLFTPLDLRLAALAGAVLVVTGPTVIGPLLRHIHLRGKSGQVLKLEGILNDPIGAVLAILTYQVIQSGQLSQAVTVVLYGIAASAFVSAFLGAAGAAVLVVTLRRGLLPPYLRALGSGAAVLIVFALSDFIQPESGLLAVTVMGVALASQTFVSTYELRRSHEDLEVMLVSVLFVVLVARIPLNSVTEVGGAALLWCASLILVVRPVAAFLGTLGSSLTWQERTLIAGIAPRGVVAAAVSSVFALKLAETDIEGREFFLPLNFAVVAITVAWYGLTAKPLASLLGLTDKAPQGLAVLGINPFSLALARGLKDVEPRVLLLDDNYRKVLRARSEGLNAEHATLPSEAEIDRIDLSDIGHFLAATSRDGLNGLVALQFQPMLEDRAYQLFEDPDAQTKQIPSHLRGRPLTDVPRSELIVRCLRGATIKLTPLTEDFGFDEFRERDPEAVPLFQLDGQGTLLTVHPLEGAPASGRLISLVGGVESGHATADIPDAPGARESDQTKA